ncbi:MAG: hypothetical protein ACREAU_00580 [Nitrosopumilaceae archaeon]
MRRKDTPIPLIIQPHPKEYAGYPFVTLIQHKREHYLTIVDNYDGAQIKAFVLDKCDPVGIDENHIIEIAFEWYENRRSQYPISFEFAKSGISSEVAKIHRTFCTEFVTRVIGPLPKFPMEEVVSIKRRKKRGLPPGVQVHQRSLVLIGE